MNNAVCPICFSKEISSEDLYLSDDEYNKVMCHLNCAQCGAYWNAIYDVSAITNIHDGDGMEIHISDEGKLIREPKKSFYILEDEIDSSMKPIDVKEDLGVIQDEGEWMLEQNDITEDSKSND